MAISYNDLKAHFPDKSIERDQLYDVLGGDWPSKKNDPNYQNTCAIRLSHALNEAGHPIPKKYKQAIDGKGRNIVLNVSKFNEYMKETFGEYTWAISKQPKENFPLSDIPSQYKGIIVYHVDFGDATGHFDMWTGSAFLGKGKEEDIKKGFDIILWNLE